MKNVTLATKILILLSLAVVSSGCTGASTREEQGTATMPPAPTMIPTISPLEKRMTDLADIETLCVTPENSHPAEAVRAVLSSAGYNVVVGDAGCEAVLRVEADFEALAGQYKNSSGSGTSTCYTGARVATTLILEIDGAVLAQSTDDGTKRPTTGNISRCPSQSGAPFRIIWERTICTNIGEIFGPLPLLEAIRNEGDSIPVNKAQSAIHLTTRESAAYATPILIEALDDDDPEIRYGAVTALMQIGPAASEATSKLIALLKDPDPDVVKQATKALGDVATDHSQAIAPLIEVLQSDDELLRQFAAASVGEFGSAAVEAVPYLIELLDDERTYTQRAAAIALTKIGAEGIEEVVPVLIPYIDLDTSFLMRMEIYEALQAVGPLALPAVSALIDAMVWEEIFVVGDLVNALKSITGENFGTDQQRWQEWWDSQE